MKLPSAKKGDEVASVLVITLCVVTILGSIMGSYLVLVRGQNASVARSQQWNIGIAVAESGVEEAMAQINSQFPLPANKVNWNGNGWSSTGSGSYQAPVRSLIDGAYKTSVSNVVSAISAPIIFSIGYTTNAITSDLLQRKVLVKTKRDFLFKVGIVAIKNIDLNGNGVTTDSYNTLFGPYTVTHAKTNGDVASAYGIVNVGNANINGALMTGPTGTNSPNTVKNNGYYLSYSSDFNMDFPDVSPPMFSSPPSYTLPPLTNNAFNFSGTNNNYQLTSLTSGNIVVRSNSSLTLYVTGNFQPDSITIQGTNSSLTVYVGVTNTTLKATTVLNSVTNSIPQQFQYFGLPDNTSITLGGNASFSGVIYAPEASLTANGSGKSNMDIFGSVIVRQLTANGHFNFHYDAALAINGPPGLYVATSWAEL